MLATFATTDSLQDRESIAEKVSFSLRASLDLALLRRVYEAEGRLRLSEILNAAAARMLYQCLTQETQWGLMVGMGPGVGRHYASAEQCQRFSMEQHRSLHDTVHALGRRDGTHLFAARPLDGDEFDVGSDSSVLTRFVEFLSTETFLIFARAVTGARDIRKVSAQATCFRAGDFCGFHTDADVHDRVRAACVFGFTIGWNRHWGGALQFRDVGGETCDIHDPGFNVLSLFNVDQWHAVSVVSDAAVSNRYSVCVFLLAN